MRRARILLSGLSAGVLSEEPDGFAFTYDVNYLQSAQAQPVSLMLPLRAEPYRSQHVPPFFAGLLAEGNLATLQCRILHIDDSDTFGRLLATCRDTIGAVTVEPMP